MQGDIITDVACRAACARVSITTIIEFSYSGKVGSKEASGLQGLGAKLVQEVVLPMQDVEDQTVTKEEGALG